MGDQQSRTSTYLLIGTGPPSRIRDGGLHHQPNPVRKYGRNWFGHGAYEIPAPGAITQQPFSWDGKSAYVLSSKFVPVSGWWNDKAEVREWQERTRVYKALKELKRKGEDLKLEKAIKPLREVYARVNPSMRSIFIAQVVYLLTK